MSEPSRNFKAASLGPEEQRKKRRTEATSLRKNKFQQANNLKRAMWDAEEPDSNFYNPNASNVSGINDISHLMNGLISDDPDMQYTAVSQFRYLMNVEEGERIQHAQMIINAGAVPLIVYLLHEFNSENVQFEAAYILTCIVCGPSEHARHVIDCDAIPHFIRMLHPIDNPLVEQAVWALGNIAGDGPYGRDLILTNGGLEKMVNVLVKNMKDRISKKGAWAIANFCHGKDPRPDFKLIKPALPIIRSMMQVKNVDVVSSACWAIMYLTENEPAQIMEIVQSGFCKRVVDLLSHSDSKILIPAIRTVLNITSSVVFVTEVMIQSGVLKKMAVLLNSSEEYITKYTCWSLSNITAGSQPQIEAVVRENLFSPLISLMLHASYLIQEEASWAVGNAVSLGTPEIQRHIADLHALSAMCSILKKNPETKLAHLLLDCIYKILFLGSQHGPGAINPYVMELEERNMLDLLSSYSHHPHTQISQIASKILSTYFSDQDDDTNNINLGFGTNNNDNNSPFSF